MLTETMLRKLWPKGDSEIPGLIAAIAAAAPTVFPKYGLTSPVVVAHFMAQISHECGAGTEVIENLNYSAEGLMKTWPSRFDRTKAARFAHKPQLIANEVYNGRMGNRLGTDDGWNFRGMGPTQTTGREEYLKLGEKLGINLVASPTSVNDPNSFLEAGVADFILCGCLPFAEKDDVMGVTRKLNGGTIGLGQRRRWTVLWKSALSEAGHVVPGAVPSPPEASLSAFETEAVQRRLRELSYPEVGMPNGDWGDRTTAAVAAFQHANGLPISGSYDATTHEALATAEPRPITDERAETTADQLVAAGSKTVVLGRQVQHVGWFKAALGSICVAGGTADHLDLLTTAQSGVDKINQVKTLQESFIDVAHAVLGHPTIIVLGVVLIGGGFVLTRYGASVVQRRVEDHRTGVHAGPSEG